MVDADEATRAVQARGSEGLGRLVEQFGQGILTADGDLDRARLAAIAFADGTKLERLNAIVHPLVRKWMAARTGEAAARGEKIVVLDVPLLYESRGDAAFDAVVLVYAPEEVALQRLVDQRGMTEAEARARTAAQLPIEEKLRRARFVIDNSGSREHLRDEVDRVWAELTA